MNYVLIGALSGVLSGMGLGGGTLLIPLLSFFAAAGQRDAQAVNLLAYLPAAAVALYVHVRAGRADLKAARPVAGWGFLGAAAGVGLALLLPEQGLKKGFGAFLCALSLVLWRGAKRRKPGAQGAYTEQKKEGSGHESDL